MAIIETTHKADQFVTGEAIYWNNNGKFQALVDALNKLVPCQGEVTNKRLNPALEKFRKASNCYYDLYNNGLYNRAAEFRGVFKVNSRAYKYREHELYAIVESKMDQIILDAAAEQLGKLAPSVDFD